MNIDATVICFLALRGFTSGGGNKPASRSIELPAMASWMGRNTLSELRSTNPCDVYLAINHSAWHQYCRLRSLQNHQRNAGTHLMAPA